MTQQHEGQEGGGRSATAPTNTPMVILDAQQHAQRELARELEEMRRSGRKLDETVPGGRYKSAGAGDAFHNAHGLPVTEEGDAKKAGGAKKGEAAQDPQQRLLEIEQERQAILGELQTQQANQQYAGNAAGEEGGASGATGGSDQGTHSEGGSNRTRASGRGRSTSSKTKA